MTFYRELYLFIDVLYLLINAKPNSQERALSPPASLESADDNSAVNIFP